MSIFTKSLVSSISGIALALSAAVGVAQAQEAAPETETEAPAAAPAQVDEDAQVDEEKLRSFAVAFLEVAKVNQVYQPQIEAAESPDEQQRLQETAGARMLEAVNAQQGISVEEYNLIIQQAQADPELAQRINGHITEAAQQQQ